MPTILAKDGTELHYREYDFTDPWLNAPYLVLQHGFGRSSKFWYRMVPYLSRWYKVICPDLRGLGESSKDFDLTMISVETYLDDLETIIGSLGAKDVHYGGESLGGILGMALAAECPQLVRTLSLFAAPLVINESSQTAFRFGHPTWQDALRTMGSFGWADAGKRAGRTSFAEDDAGHRDWYSAEMGKSEVNVLIAMTYVAQTVDVKPVLHKIKAPVLGLYPTGGEVTTGDQFETMRRDIKDLKIVHLPGPRHLVQSLHPAACAEQVLHFMALHDGRACHE